MTREVLYDAAARRELRSAVLESDAQFGRGSELDAAVRAIEVSIARDPEARHVARDGPSRRDDVRQARVPGFPYRLVFLVRDRAIVILAFAHLRRRPGYWHRRLR